MKATMKKSAVALLALSLAACQGSGDKPNIELIQDMMVSPALKAQKYDEDSPNHAAMRVPPENTVPVAFVPYKYAKDIDGAIKELKNPMPAELAQNDMFQGTRMFETNCAVCHGHHGEGGEASGSTVAALMALKPPSLLSDKIRGTTDGQIYHIITMGQGTMGPYASHVPQKYRWQLVSYIRHLQKTANK